PTDVNEGNGLGIIDLFPAPGPPTNFVFATQLSQFFNTNPNGDWRLFVVDDHGHQGGEISRWVLDFGHDEFVFPNVSLTAPTMLTNGWLQMRLNGEVNKVYFLEASTDLVDWTIVQTN